MHHMHPLRGDVMLTSVKSCCLPTKIYISLNFCVIKHYSHHKFICKYQNKNWSHSGSDHFIKKIDKYDSIVHRIA